MQIPEKKMQKKKIITPENNARGNMVGTSPFMAEFGENTVNDADQKQTQESYKSQGWQPIQARRKNRLEKLALFDTFNPQSSGAGSNNFPGAMDGSQGYGSPFNAAGESPMRDSVKWDSLTDPEKKKFKKKTRDPIQYENGVEDF